MRRYLIIVMSLAIIFLFFWIAMLKNTVTNERKKVKDLEKLRVMYDELFCFSGISATAVSNISKGTRIGDTLKIQPRIFGRQMQITGKAHFQAYVLLYKFDEATNGYQKIDSLLYDTGLEYFNIFSEKNGKSFLFGVIKIPSFKGNYINLEFYYSFEVLKSGLIVENSTDISRENELFSKFVSFVAR